MPQKRGMGARRVGKECFSLLDCAGMRKEISRPAICKSASIFRKDIGVFCKKSFLCLEYYGTIILAIKAA